MGSTTLHMLRAEKGFIVIVGQETDGTVTPDDLGLGKMAAMAKPDFIGKRSLALPELTRAGRKQLVGLLPDDPNLDVDEGAQIVADRAPPIGSPALGHVTSSYFSPTLDRSFALALVADGRARSARRCSRRRGRRPRRSGWSSRCSTTRKAGALML